MIEIRGRYNSATVYTDEVEPSAARQIETLCNQPFIEGSRIRIMPDVHAGAGCTIGTTMTISDKVIPNLVGVDIGCGMETARIDAEEIDCAHLDRLIRTSIPSGFEVRKRPHPYAEQIDLSQLRCAARVKIDRGYKSIGTLGGGNHFIEANRDDEGNLYVVVHSGSRHLGLEVATYYQNEGYARLNGNGSAGCERLVAEYRAAGQHREIDKALKELRRRRGTDIPQSLAYVEGALFDDYLQDMKLTQRFASLNRAAMMETILDGLGTQALERFTTIHNYIDAEGMILRKGAVRALAGEKLLIPMNMRDGSLICIGKGNEEWNCSAPHGAGRLMSRTQARSALSLDEYRKNMEGVYSTSVDRHTLDEAPMAYKAMADIVKHIGDTVTIERRIRPVYNFKAAE